MEDLLRELRFAFRTLVKQPGFTAVAVLSLALGVGANTAIFTVINAVFLHPLAIEEPSRVVEVFTHDTKTVQVGNLNLTPSSLQNFEDFREQNPVFSALAGYFGFGLQWTTEKGEVEPLPGMMTTSNYFDVLGIKPAVGRLFSGDEDLGKQSPVAVLSHSVWTTRFGSDRHVVGRTITLNGLTFTVIGVTPPGFKGTISLAAADRVWIPLGMRDLVLSGQVKALSTNRRFRWISIVGRLKPGVALTQARAAMKTIAASLEKQYPEANQGRTVELASVSESALGINNRTQFLRAGGVMMAIVSLVLLIACVNLSNLLLAQAARREKDISICAALGANRGRIVRQLLIESVLLAIGGGALGLVVAYWGRNALWAFRPPFLTAASIDLSLDRTVLLFTGGVSLLTGVAFGLVPAMKLSRTNPIDALKLGGRSGTLGLAHGHLRGVLVVAEIALATVALVGAGLFVRSMQAAQRMDLGFDAPHIAFVGLNPGVQRYDESRGQQFYLDAIAGARQVHGVKGAAVASIVPAVGGAGVLLTVFPEGQAEATGARGSLITFNDVTPGYFDALGIRFREGRDFTEFDREGTTEVAIVNEAVARQLWPGQGALGKRFTIVQRPELYEIVGVVADSVVNAVGEEPTPLICRPMRQEYAPAAALIVRAADDPNAVIGGVRDRVLALDRHMPMRNVGTIMEQIEQGLWAPRMGAALLSIFGGLAFALAMIGIYGVMSYNVAQRTSEIGFRIAIGARPVDVLWLVMRQGLSLAVQGSVVGVVVAVLLGRLIADLLFGIRPHDPLTLSVVVVTLCAVAVLACYVPARRATRTDPLAALRSE
jgi:predicted permease